MNGEAGKGSDRRPFDRAKWDAGFNAALAATCDHRWLFSHHYLTLSGKKASCDECTKCGRYRLRAGTTERK